MLKLRNLTLFRRLYVSLLTLMTRIVYGAEARIRARRARPRLDDSRIRRINSELEFGPGVWEGAFLEAHSAGTDDELEDSAVAVVEAAAAATEAASAAATTDIAARAANASARPARVGGIPANGTSGAGFAAGSISSQRGRDLPPFALADTAVCVSDAIDAILGDSLTRCFTAEPSEPWNFLTRNLPPGRWSLSPYLTLLWLLGLWGRYCVLLPIRIFILLLGTLSCCIAFPCAWLIPKSLLGVRTVVLKFLLRYLASVFVASWSGYIRFHGKRPTRRPNQIYVANHASLIDVVVLLKDYNFSFIGQRHRGLAGLLQDLLLSVQDHVWFDRDEGRDRRVVQRLLQEHVMDGSNEPMLVFPEGTCSTTEYCVMFKKGSFELGATVYPIAMRYRKEYGDAFWNSSLVSFPRHFLDLMTSWAVVCDVYYLPPETMQPGETSVQFAKRVKQKICQAAGLVDVNWDGFLKRHRISPKFLEQRQKAFAAIIMRRLKGDVPRPFSTSAIASLPQGRLARTGSSSPLARSSLDDRHLGALRRRGNVQPQLLGEQSTAAPGDAPWGTCAAAGDSAPLARPKGRIHQATAALFAALHSFFRWGVAFTLLAIAGTITAYLIPTSWRNFTTWRKAVLPVL